MRIFDSEDLSTSAPDCVRALISAENVTSSARAIFHSTLIVGALCPSSIWPSIARDTPEICASRSSDKPRRVRRRRRFVPTRGARSVCASTAVAAVVGVGDGAVGASTTADLFAGFFFT